MTLATALALVATPAWAHHGNSGDYDRTRPTYVAGTVTAAEYGFPHGEIMIAVAAGVGLPLDRSRFAELDVLDGRPTLELLTAAEPGNHVVSLPLEINNRLASASDRPEIGDYVEVVAYPRCPQGDEFDDELRVQAIVAGASETVYRRPGAGAARYTDGCGGSPAEQTTPASEPAGTNREEPAAWTWFVLAAPLVAIAGAVGGWAYRRRRSARRAR